MRLRVLRDLINSEEFEHFLHSRFIGQKRFALEGGEAAIAILEAILRRAANHDVQEAIIGMSHRGRLNLLANALGIDVKWIFSEFEGVDPSSVQGSGDVKYHLGGLGMRKFENGRELKISVAPNPSHLEAVDPVVEGITRPKQDAAGDVNRERIIPLLLARRCRFRRTRRSGRNAQSRRARRLFHGRHHPSDHQQPDRLHHAARRIALHAILHRYLARFPGPHLPHQRATIRKPASASRRSPTITASSSKATS